MNLAFFHPRSPYLPANGPSPALPRGRRPCRPSSTMRGPEAMGILTAEDLRRKIEEVQERVAEASKPNWPYWLFGWWTTSTP